jgi:hypothetical protein
MEKPLIRVSEMERRGIREAGDFARAGGERVFDLLHEGFALEEVGLEARRELAGHDEELIVDHF